MLKSLVDLLINKGLVLLLFATLLFGMSPFSSSPLISEAHPSRLAETHMLLERALGQQGWISGWDQRFQCGYPVGIYQYQTGPLLIAATSALTGLPLSISYKIILYLLTLFAIAMVWRFLLLRVSSGVALAATLALFIGSGFIEQMVQGFWNCAISLGFLALFLDCLSRVDRLDARHSIRLMFIYALIILTHQYAAIAAGILMLGMLPAYLRIGGLKSLLWWIAIPLGALLLTLFYVYPILETNHWLVPSENDGILPMDAFVFGLVNLTDTDFIQALLTKQGAIEALKDFIKAWPNLAAEAMALTLFAHWRAGRLSPKEKRLALGLLIAFCTFAMINLNLMVLVPVERVREATSQIISYRFKIFSDFCLFLLAALALHHWNILYRTSPSASWKKFRKILTPKVMTAGFIFIFSLAIALTQYRLAANHRNDILTDIPDLQKNLLDTWRWFQSTDRGPYRVLYESTYRNFPADDQGPGTSLRQSTITAMGALYSGMPQTSGVYNAILPMHHYTRTSNGWLMGMRLKDLDPDVVFYRLQTCNIGYFVTCSEPYRQFFNAAPSMDIKANFGPFTVYQYRDAPGNWAWTDQGDPVTFSFDPENDAHMTASFSNENPGQNLHVRVAWHPYWRATLNGSPLALEPDAEGMIQAQIDKPGLIEVDYLFSSRNLPVPVLIINALFLAGLIIALAWERFRKPARDRKTPA